MGRALVRGIKELNNNTVFTRFHLKPILSGLIIICALLWWPGKKEFSAKDNEWTTPIWSLFQVSGGPEVPLFTLHFSMSELKHTTLYKSPERCGKVLVTGSGSNNKAPVLGGRYDGQLFCTEAVNTALITLHSSTSAVLLLTINHTRLTMTAVILYIAWGRKTCSGRKCRHDSAHCCLFV